MRLDLPRLGFLEAVDRNPESLTWVVKILRKIGTILIKTTMDRTFQEAQMNRSKSLRICEVYAPWILTHHKKKMDHHYLKPQGLMFQTSQTGQM